MAGSHAYPEKVDGWGWETRLKENYAPELAPSSGGLEAVAPSPSWHDHHHDAGLHPVPQPLDHRQQGFAGHDGAAAATADTAYHAAQRCYHLPPAPSERPRKTKVLGVPVLVFWALVAGIVLAAVGLGVGLGVGLRSNGGNGAGSSSSSSSGGGGQPAAAESPPPPPPPVSPTPSSTGAAETPGAGLGTSSSSTSTSTTSTSAAPPAFVTSGTTGLAANSCSSRTPKTFVGPGDRTMTQYCFTDWPNGAEAADGSGPIRDIARFTVYTFEDCMLRCLDRNRNLGATQARCMAVTYNSNLTSIIAVGKQGGNCFLKDKKGVDHQGTAESASAAVA